MAKLIANTASMSEQEWLEKRRHGIGGSDAAGIAGASKYTSPVMVYMDKTGRYISDKPDRVKEAAHWGNTLEPVIREEFKNRINAERKEKGLNPIRMVHRKAIFAHDEHDWMRTNLDGLVYVPELGKGVFEAKTAHYMLREEWEGEDVPNAYYIQVQHNMAVMNANFAYLAVLIGGNTFKYYFIERDQEFIDYLIEIEKKFWFSHILPKIPPAFTGHAEEKKMLSEQYPNSQATDGYIVTLPTAAIELAERVDAYKQLITELQQEQTADENEIKAMLGDTEQAFAGSHKITWKTASNGVRSMRIKLDSQDDRNKFYSAKLKDVVKRQKEVDKARKMIEKEAEKQRKADEKARKAAEKEAARLLKESEKELKKLEKETGKAQKTPEYEVIRKDELEELYNDSNWLACLESAGVDNWSGIEYAIELRREEENESEEN